MEGGVGRRGGDSAGSVGLVDVLGDADVAILAPALLRKKERRREEGEREGKRVRIYSDILSLSGDWSSRTEAHEFLIFQ